MINLKSSFSILVLAFFLSGFTAYAQTFNVDVDASEIKWTGYHLAKSYEHWGNVKIKSGKIIMDGDNISSGEIIIDMTSITNGDLESEKENAKLVKHLKSKDFFSINSFPEAKLSILGGDRSGGLRADLTIRGITKKIVFEYTKVSATDNDIIYTAKLKVDRTKYKVMYGWSIENAMLSNQFLLDVKIVAKK